MLLTWTSNNTWLTFFIILIIYNVIDKIITKNTDYAELQEELENLKRQQGTSTNRAQYTQEGLRQQYYSQFNQTGTQEAYARRQQEAYHRYYQSGFGAKQWTKAEQRTLVKRKYKEVSS